MDNPFLFVGVILGITKIAMTVPMTATFILYNNCPRQCSFKVARDLVPRQIELNYVITPI